MIFDSFGTPKQPVSRARRHQKRVFFLYLILCEGIAKMGDILDISKVLLVKGLGVHALWCLSGTTKPTNTTIQTIANMPFFCHYSYYTKEGNQTKISRK
tara:strand:+ start:566 stop:862 length:297 start_codon:yes stop_codon:yes gene_type:complete